VPGVSSVQITFHEDRDPPLHAMPPGGFRLAIVNCWNLEVGLTARNRLRACFPRALRTRSIVKVNALTVANGTGNVPGLKDALVSLRDRHSGNGSSGLGWCRTVTTAEFDSTYRAVLHHIQTYADSRYLGIAVGWTSRMSASRSTP
jgi:hypothetical protein